MLYVMAILALAAAPAAAIVMLHRYFSRPQRIPMGVDSIDDLSTDRYRPMLRLLHPDDFEFARAQPGFTRKMETNLRRQRCEVFRGYLNLLTDDFSRVSMGIKLLMTQSHCDRPDLASMLIRSQLNFAWGIALIHLRLTLFTWGVGSVSVTGILDIFDKLRLELRSLVPAAAPLVA